MRAVILLTLLIVRASSKSRKRLKRLPARSNPTSRNYQLLLRLNRIEVIASKYGPHLSILH
jgi:hypothetical protein